MNNEITIAQEQQLKDLTEQAIKLGFNWGFQRDDSLSETRWITLFKSNEPARRRYQFEESPQGLDELTDFLMEHGNWSSTATNKAGDTIGITVDREQKQHKVTYVGLVGYDAVEFHVVDETEAQILYTALLAVEQVEAD